MTSGLLVPSYYGNNIPKPDLLLHFEGMNTSRLFNDSSTANRTVSSNNSNCQLSTAQSKFGSSSLYHANTNSGEAYIDPSVANNSRMAFGTEDFTIEMWVYRMGTTNSQMLADFRGTNTSGTSICPALYIRKNGSNYVLETYVNGVIVSTGTTNIPANTWCHVAWTRKAGISRLFMNGNFEVSWFDTNNYIVGNNRPAFGRENNATTNGNWLYGYIDEVRIFKGYAAWTSAFTPPISSYTPDPRTCLEIALTGSSTTSATGVNTRRVLQPAVLNSSGTKVRLTLRGTNNANESAFGSVYIGHAATSGNYYDFDGTQVPVTFGGSTSVTIPNNSHIASDWINYPLDNTKAFIISTYRLGNSSASQAYINGLNTTNYRMPNLANNTDEAGNNTWSAAASNQDGYFSQITKIEVL